MNRNALIYKPKYRVVILENEYFFDSFYEFFRFPFQQYYETLRYPPVMDYEANRRNELDN
jgi:hypothetical protein